MSSPAAGRRPHRKAPERATLKRAVKGLDRVLSRSPDDLRSMVRMARAHRLLGNQEASAFWYKRAISGFSDRRQGLRALALAKELVAVAPHDHEVLLEMARLYARNPGAGGADRIARPLDEGAGGSTKVARIPREFTATSAKALEILDDAAEVERIEADAEEAAEKAAEKASARPAPEVIEGGAPPPPPVEAFLVDDADEPDTALAVSETAEPTPPPQPKKQGPPPAKAKAERLGGGAGKPPPPGGTLERARLGEVPLLSSLGENAFLALSEAMRPHALRDGEILFREGDAARSFYIVAEGRIEATVSRGGEQRVIASLSEGDVVGVFGLYTGKKRNATAHAVGPATVFEVTDGVLARLVREHPAAKKPLAAFYRQRLLETSLGSSPLFQDLPREMRQEIIDRFEQRRYAARESVVAPGQVTLGLFLVVRGEVLISTRGSGRSTLKAQLGRGQFFGCISALTGMPTVASAECSEDSVIAFLPHKAFGELIQRHPELAALPGRLREANVLVTPTLFVGDVDAVRSETT
jgi:cAMP-dependent protein kinase regulator